MALLSQVSTSYPRVPRDSFLPSYGIFSLSGYRHFPFILLQHAACFFTYIDCRIQITIYPISTCTKIYSVRKFQFFLYTATFTAFFTGREKTVYTYQFLSSGFGFFRDIMQHVFSVGNNYCFLSRNGITFSVLLPSAPHLDRKSVV